MTAWKKSLQTTDSEQEKAGKRFLTQENHSYNNKTNK
jgi:hypothetical protein